jgi:hypothetical protein
MAVFKGRVCHTGQPLHRLINKLTTPAVQLEPAEMEEIVARHGAMHGNSMETEHTVLLVLTRQQILEGRLVDYATLGQLSLIGGH